MSALEDDDFAALEAVYREQQRQRGIEPPRQTIGWAPSDPLQAAVWSQLRTDGSGVEYERLVRTVASARGHEQDVRMAILDLVLDGRIYVTAAHQAGVSLVGRGTDPRCGQVAYRSGALGRWR